MKSIARWRQLCLLLITTLVFVCLVDYSLSGRSRVESPRLVVGSLDTAIQIRFHKVNPGKFGEHALIGVGDGPLTGVIDPLETESAKERSLFLPALDSHRVVIIALMHCRFKPGRNIALDNVPGGDVFSPSTQVLETLAPSQHDADQHFAWAEKNLDNAALKYYPAAMTNTSTDSHVDGYFIAVRPVTAHYPLCLTCHHGAKLGNTIAAMVYLVADRKSPKPCKFVKRTDI
jgi:hypothetical protein